MATTCITKQARDRASRECNWASPATFPACQRARMRLCPPPDVQPTIQAGADGINLLGVYQICSPKPTALAPYPPSRAMPHEEAAQAALDRLSTAAVKQSSEVLKLKSQASKARKIELSPGFWLGLGLVGLGGAALYFRR